MLSTRAISKTLHRISTSIGKSSKFKTQSKVPQSSAKAQSAAAARLVPFASIPLFAFSLIGSSSSSNKKSPNPTMSAANKELIENADQLMDESRYKECLDLLQTVQDQTDPAILWRKSRSYQKLSKSADKKTKEEYIRKAFELIKEALAKDDNNFAIHKWYAIILDANAELDGIKSRVSQLETVRHHMIRATELNPNDPTSWYILGEFEYSLADMSWYVQKIVATIFAAPPTGSFEKALECFQKAEAIEPGFYSKNNLMLGKTYMHFKDHEKAKEQFTIAANIKPANIDDKTAKEEAEKLLKKL